MKKIIVPTTYNYVGVFLTLACNLKCGYCINRFTDNPKGGFMSGEDWIKGLNRLALREDLPITLQGGEPTLHKDFYQIINGIDAHSNIDLMTNCTFDSEEFMRNIKTTKIKRNAPYASIRVSYHPGQQDMMFLFRKVKMLQDLGYSIGIWAIDHPEYKQIIKSANSLADYLQIDFRLKEFLGYYNGKLYGQYKYPNGLSHIHKKVQCKTTELLIGPDGFIYRCHADLYAHGGPIGHILDNDFQITDTYKECLNFGECNPCDIKIKTNRFQIMGHTSVDILEVK